MIDGVKQFGTITAFAKYLHIPRTTVRDWYRRAINSKVDTRVAEDFKATSYLISYAQIDTPVHVGFLKSLEKMAKEHKATILISGGTYNVEGSDHSGNGDAKKKLHQDCFDKKIRKYLCNERLQLNDNFEYLGNLNILPTAVNPLTGYQTFTGTNSACIPHPKIALESVATSPDRLAKLIMTCGSVTHPNYMQKNAGIKGEFHHQIGALLVEIVDNKTFHYRHVLAEDDGSFYDLTERYEEGKIAFVEDAVDSIVWGDIHEVDLDKEVAEASWFGEDCLIDVLRPKYQFFHDLLDFKYRNHHSRDDVMFAKSIGARATVIDEIFGAVRFLTDSERDFCKSVVVASNHDNAYTRWVREVTHREEPNLDNTILLLRSQCFAHEYMKENGHEHPNLFQWVCEQLSSVNPIYARVINNTKFLNKDESFEVNGVECGMHGDKGVNGAKGSLKSYAKIGCKSTTGHSHSCGIYEGSHAVGCCRTLRAGYAEGPSSWSHTQCIQYKNGKRTLITCINSKYYKRVPRTS